MKCNKMATESSMLNKQNNTFLIFSILSATIGAISDGMHLGFTCALFKLLNNNTSNLIPNATLGTGENVSLLVTTVNTKTVYYPTNITEYMLVKTFYMLGAFTGIFFCFILKSLGAKKAISLASLICFISWIIIATISSITGLYIARVFAGISVVLTITAVPKYVAEIKNNSTNNASMNLVYYKLLLGVLIIYILGPYLPFLVLSVFGAIVSFLQLILSFCISESPHFLIRSNRNLEAKESLQKIRMNRNVDKELSGIRSALIRQKRESSSQTLLNPVQNRRATVYVFVASAAQQLTGITAFIMSLHEILHDCDIYYATNEAISIIFVLVIISIGFLSEFKSIKDKTKLRIASSVTSTLALMVLGVYCSLKKFGTDLSDVRWLPILSIILYGIAFRFDKGYFLNKIVDDVYPDSYRYNGTIFATLIQVLFAWISIEIFQRVSDRIGMHVPLYFFAVLNLTNTLIMEIVLPPVKKKEVVRSRYFRSPDGVVGVNDEDFECYDGEVTELIENFHISNTADSKTIDMTVAAASATENIFSGTLPQLVAVLTGTLTAVSDGMQYGWTSPVLPMLMAPDSPVKVTESQAEWLETLLMLGSFSGLWITMYLVDKIGRKRSILLASFVTLLIWIIIAAAPRVEYIFVARAFAGSAGNMAFVATPMYIAEIAEQKIRGFLSSLIYLMMLVGILIIYAIAPYIPFYAHCILGAALALTELCIFPFMPESPYYLLYKDQPEAAEQSLRRLRRSGANIDKELEDIKAAVTRQKTERGKIQDLVLVPSNRRAMLIMALLNAAQHFSSISVLLMNIHIILAEAGSIYVESRIAAILFSVMMLLAATVASFSIDKYGRKTLLISSSLSAGICLLILAIYFSLKNGGYNVAGVSWIPAVCVMLYALCFKLGLGMVPIVLTAELFPTKMKAYGMTLADGFYVISSLLSLQVYQRLKDSFGLQYPFYIFSASCLIAAVFTYVFIPETKGKSLEEIQMILKGKDGKCPKESKHI